MKRRRSALRRRYGRARSRFGHALRWSTPDRGVQRLLDVPRGRGEVLVMAYPHFAEASLAPARGRMSVEMSFSGASAARAWAEDQARRLGFLEAA
jgi:hypothetical protein